MTRRRNKRRSHHKIPIYPQIPLHGQLPQGTLHDRLDPGRSCTLNRFDEVGADVRLRARFADLANENVYATKGDPVPVLD